MAKISEVNGANIRIDNVEKEKVKITTITVGIDDTSKDIVKSMEKLERVEIIFPKDVFVELPIEKLKGKLTAESIMKYGIAKRDWEADKRITKRLKEDPTFRKLHISGGDLNSRMAFTKSEQKKFKGKHLAILNDYELDAAKDAGYELVSSDPIVSINPASKVKETLYKVAVNQEAFDSHCKAVSIESKGKIKKLVNENEDGNLSITVPYNK